MFNMKQPEHLSEASRTPYGENAPIKNCKLCMQTTNNHEDKACAVVKKNKTKHFFS